MYSIQIVVLLMLNNVLTNINAASYVTKDSSAGVSNIEIPEGQTVEQYMQTVIDFWTDERLKAAKPKPLIRIDGVSTNKNANNRGIINENEKPVVIEGTAPASLNMLKRDGYPNTVGKVFFVDGSDEYTCSASVVTADNKDMIFTAGHCVYSSTHFAFMKNFVFIPQYENGTRPYGTWPARCLYALQDWISRIDHDSDVAIVLLYPLNGQHIQDRVGSQGVGFNHDHSGNIYSFGYPINYYKAEIMTYCSANKYAADIPNYNGDRLSCTMREGCSGGPWFESYSVSTLSGIQTSVNSFGRQDIPDVLFGPHFGSAIQALYDRANGNGTCDNSQANHSTSSVVVLLLSLHLLQYLQNLLSK